jgi:hypothetical protein
MKTELLYALVKNIFTKIMKLPQKTKQSTNYPSLQESLLFPYPYPPKKAV